MLLSAVAVADFPLFMFMLIYKVLYYPGRIYAALQVLGQNLPVVFGQTITWIRLALFGWTSGLLVY